MKRMSFAAALIGTAVFVSLASLFELNLVRIETTSIFKKFLFLLLLNLTIVLLLMLIFFVGKSLYGLYIERKRRVPGHKFKTKMVLLFVILASIPSGLLFFMALALGTNYIERLFTPQFRQPVESSIAVAKAVYEIERKQAIEYALIAASGTSLPSNYSVSRFNALPEDASFSIRMAFAGERTAEIISTEGRDLVRAAVPVPTGVIVVETFIPEDITKEVQAIKNAYEDYLRFASWGGLLKLNFFLILGFSALFVIFLSLWASLRVAGRITGPVRLLSEATEAVAGGDLSVSVATESKDEIGLLINSFNRMVGELKEGKESLENAYIESNTQRLYMENILGNIESGVISLNAKGIVTIINPSATDILGLKADDVLGRDYQAILSKIDSEELKKCIKDINLKTFRAVEHEIEVVLGQRKVVLRISITGLRDSGGGYLGLLVVFDDLTSLIKAQRALAWQEIARRIAHEIKNPLTPIKLSTERMLKKWQEKDPDFSLIFERSTNTIIKEVDALKRLVDEFSKFGKMPEIHKSLTELKPVVEEVVSLYKAYKNLGLSVSGSDVSLELDREQMRRVLINLFDNAIEAMKEQGSITVNIMPDLPLNKVFISIADNGPGIKDIDKAMLFMPYFSTKKDGTGLGLAIADRIIAEHKGSLRVSDNKPHGSVFTIELPIKEG